MAEGPRTDIHDSRCRFSDTHGCNVVVNGNKVEWSSRDSGGRLFVYESLSVGANMTLVFDGKGHAEVGVTKEDPGTVADVRSVMERKTFIPIQTARIYKQRGTTSITRNGSMVITESEGKQNETKIDKREKVWITIYLVFGDLTVNIGSPDYRFSGNKGDNIEISNSGKEAKLRCTNPRALCFLSVPLERGEFVMFKINPQTRDGKKSRNYSIKVGMSESSPECFVSDSDLSSVSSGFENEVHIHNLPPKSYGQLKLELMEDGRLKLNHRKGSDIYKQKTFKQIFCILEICRVTVECIAIEKIGDDNVADTIVIMDEIEELQEEIRNISLMNSIRYQHTQQERSPTSATEEQRSPDAVVTERQLHTDAMVTELQRPVDAMVTEGPPNDIANLLSQILNRLNSIEEQVCRKDSDVQQQYIQLQVQSLRNEIKEIRKTEEEQPNPQERRNQQLNDILTKNYSHIVNDMEPINFADLLLQNQKITFPFHEQLRKRHESNRQEANRELIEKLRRIDLSTELFISILRETKQDGLLAKISTN